MDSITFVWAWALAVAGMTAFSAGWSLISKNQFREPNLLTEVLQKHPAHTTPTKPTALAWLIHIGLGAVFLVLYEILWRMTGVERNLIWGLVFGSVLGIIGILGWALMFTAVNFKPPFNTTHYYIHLYLAHLVFSMVALWVYHTVQ